MEPNKRYLNHYIVEDSSFIVAIFDKNDNLHQHALCIFNILNQNKACIKILIPPLAIYEVIVTLKRKGIPQNVIEDRVMRFINMQNIVISSIAEVSAFKHCKRLLTSESKDIALRTNDYIIASMGMDYNAQIITFDGKLCKKVLPYYELIYNCSKQSEINRFQAELNEFLL